MGTAEQQLKEFLNKYTPPMAVLGDVLVKKLRKRHPTATAWVYDNYNALVIGFGAPARPSAVFFSIALYPKWATLFFMDGVRFKDPHHLLKGDGKTVRQFRLSGADDLDRADVQSLFEEALAIAKTPLPNSGKGELVIQSISAKQRPRRPSLK